MKIRDILQRLPQENLEALARQRLSQIADIRLPISVLSDELADALTSFAYVHSLVVVRHPPSFAIMNILINSPDYATASENFCQRVREETDRMITISIRQPIFPKTKQYGLYMKLLEAAWEMDTDINASEANLLKVLRQELSISIMEHFVMEHHPDLHRFWKSDDDYERERNYLLGAGILFAHNNQYMLAEETVGQIRRAWGFELSSAQYGRFLDMLANDDLKRILDHEGLPVSGTSEEKKRRIYENYVSPRTALTSLNVETLRNAARSFLCHAGGAKDELVDSLIDWLDSDEDIKARMAQEKATEPQPEMLKEPRELSREAFLDVLRNLTNDDLYDLICQIPGMMKSGSKDQRINRLVESCFSERSILLKLTNEELYYLSKQLGLNPYGIKDEKISRIIEARRGFGPQSVDRNGTSMSSPAGQIVQVPHDQLKMWPVVAAEYPFLSESERVILSYLLDFRSLTDSELEKLVQRFSIPWILPKAQMGELINKLIANGRDILTIRALGDNNIYQVKG